MGEHDQLHGIAWKNPLELRDGHRVGEGMCRRLTKKRVGAIDGELRCERCGAVGLYDGGKSVTLHHRRKRSQLPKWRLWEPSNCVWLCGDGTTGCHGWVEHNPDAGRMEGFHVRSFEEAREVPVLLWHTPTMLLLTDDGGWEIPAP